MERFQVPRQKTFINEKSELIMAQKFFKEFNSGL